MKIVMFPEVVEFLEGPGVRNWQFKDSGIKLINIRNLVNDKIILSNTSNHLDKEEIDKKYKHFLLKEGDYIIASSGVTWGKIAEVKKEHLPLCLNTSIIKIVPKNKDILEKRYLWHFIKSSIFTRQIDKLITGSAQPNFGPSHLNKIKIFIPPLNIQQKIASILDAADELRQKDEALVAKYNELTQALFLDMFGDPIINNKEFKLTTLNDVCKKITDGTHHSPENLISGDFPYITAKNLKRNGIDLSNLTYISKETHEEIFKRCNPEYGDILYIKDGATTGIACINSLTFEFSMLSSVALLKPNRNFTNEYYLQELLNSERMYNHIRSKMGGAAITRLTLEKIKKITFPNPPIELQNKFADQQKLIQKQKQLAEESLKNSEALFNSLLDKAFKGELTSP